MLASLLFKNGFLELQVVGSNAAADLQNALHGNSG